QQQRRMLQRVEQRGKRAFVLHSGTHATQGNDTLMHGTRLNVAQPLVQIPALDTLPADASLVGQLPDLVDAAIFPPFLQQQLKNILGILLQQLTDGVNAVHPFLAAHLGLPLFLAAAVRTFLRVRGFFGAAGASAVAAFPPRLLALAPRPRRDFPAGEAWPSFFCAPLPGPPLPGPPLPSPASPAPSSIARSILRSSRSTRTTFTRTVSPR